MNKREIGSKYEKIAVGFLKEKGYQILEVNYQSRTGEIDIVSKIDGYYSFVEVKYRTDTKHGYPAEAVDYRKQKHITRTAELYLLRHDLSEFTPCKFDVVVILGEQIELIENAFEAI